SPSTRSRDCLLKLRKYEAAGVREYWIIDQERELIDVYRFEKECVDKYSFNDQVPTDILEGLSVDFSAMNIR
ncbi:MAG: Uma2 family endonuclease, partial [Hungatella hathewayi]|nr:Uma2 family endonuclease [Hungatella hathewayi]